jgi:putative transposase
MTVQSYERSWRNGEQSCYPEQAKPEAVLQLQQKAYKEYDKIENAFCQLKGFRRIATRYDRLAVNFVASVHLVAAVVWWIL